MCIFVFFFLIGILLLYNVVSFCCTTESISYMYTYIPSLLDLPLTPTLILSIQVITEHRAELLALSSRFSWLCVLHLVVYICQPQSPNSSHPSILHLMSTSLISMSASLFLPCKQVHLYHFSRFHIYVLIYNICFSISALTHLPPMTLGNQCTLHQEM